MGTASPPDGVNLGKTGIQSEDPSSHRDILQGIFLGEFCNNRGEGEGEDGCGIPPQIPCFSFQREIWGY